MNNYLAQDSLKNCLAKVLDYRGKTPKKLGGDWSMAGYRAISANNVKHDGLHKNEDIKFLDEKLYKKWMREEIMRGDIILTSEAPAGQVMVWDSDEKIVLSQRLYGLRVGEKVDNWYLKYYLQSEIGQKEIFRNNSGSTVSGISAKTFSNIIIRFPDKPIQIIIGNLLKTLDKEIELNNRINAELEHMAKTLYDYWFVQFDFPDQNGKPYKVSGGKMVWNEELTREIPEGWKVKKVGDITDVKRGKNITRKTIQEGNIPVIAAGLDPSCYHNVSNTIAPVVTISGSGANAGYIQLHNTNVWASDCSFIDMTTTKYVYIMYLFLKNRQKEIFDMQKGSAQPHVYPADIMELKIVTDTNFYFIDNFLEIVSPQLEVIGKLKQENQKISEIRDWLLPMLMNGQVKVT